MRKNNNPQRNRGLPKWEPGQAMYYLTSFNMTLATFMMVAATMGIASWASVGRLFDIAAGSTWFAYTFASAYTMWSYCAWHWEERKLSRCSNK